MRRPSIKFSELFLSICLFNENYNLYKKVSMYCMISNQSQYKRCADNKLLWIG